MPPPPPPLPLPMHLQNQQQQSQQQQTVPLFQMTSSYSSNSQNSKASSLLGNTVSTGVSNSCSPPPLPPPLQINQNGLFGANSNVLTPAYYSSPSKNLNMHTSTNLFASKFNATLAQNVDANGGNIGRIYRDLDPVNSLRMSQRNFSPQSTFNAGSNLNHIPGKINDQFE